jgi:hypothetical protein
MLVRSTPLTVHETATTDAVGACVGDTVGPNVTKVSDAASSHAGRGAGAADTFAVASADDAKSVVVVRLPAFVGSVGLCMSDEPVLICSRGATPSSLLSWLLTSRRMRPRLCNKAAGPSSTFLAIVS